MDWFKLDGEGFRRHIYLSISTTQHGGLGQSIIFAQDKNNHIASELNLEKYICIVMQASLPLNHGG